VTTILKGYQFRLYPSDEQKKLINQTIGCSRFIYNHFLEERMIIKKQVYQKLVMNK